MLPEDAADKRAQWSSSDNAIATVYDNSTVTAVGEVTTGSKAAYEADTDWRNTFTAITEI